eukprot:symbB.v1.2.009210.t1/scaffold580.1/size320225/12
MESEFGKLFLSNYRPAPLRDSEQPPEARFAAAKMRAAPVPPVHSDGESDSTATPGGQDRKPEVNTC